MWQKYALGEAIMKIASAILQKLIGLAMTLPATALLYSAVIGIVQLCLGWRFRATSVFQDKKGILLSIGSGILAAIANVLGPVAFMYGADLAGRTFIVTMAVVPSMFIGQLLFGQALIWRQYVGVVLFLFGAWAIFDGPNVVAHVTNPPTWVLVTVIVMFVGAIHESLKTAMPKHYDTMVNNFWVGATTACGSLGLYGALYVWVPTYAQLDDIQSMFFVVSFLTGVVVAFMISLGLRSYQSGAFLVLKKVLVTSAYLVGVAIIGHVWFGESLTTLRSCGIGLFVLAVFFSDTAAWSIFRSRRL